MAGEVEFIMQRFRDYYRRCPPPPPERFGRREFGFMFFDRNFVQRHLGFARKSDLHDFLRDRVPSHCYYSTAYYKDPAAERMEDKTWLGADLIFDLDADHIRGAEGLSYTDMLALVKREMARLLDDFILGDLGFDERHLKVTFSGGRGYHAHISDPRLLMLRSHERREIVDYITGTDLSMEWLMPERTSAEKRYGSTGIVQSFATRMLPPAGSGGWKGKLRSRLPELLDEMEAVGPQGARARYPALAGEKEELVLALYQDLFDGPPGRRGRDRMLQKGNLADVREKLVPMLVRLIDQELRPRISGQVDEPVTSDIKRLIRMPSSLHGKTGLRVVKMTRDELDSFDPLRDAIPSTLGDGPVRLMMAKRVDVRLQGERYCLEGEVEVPERAALFLLCRREATLP
ncbi:MAG: DNA primase small subunit PriS [Methanomassiliicoccales archaeon]|nr:DNA primase small subunit PriS [Methanomassiliicoccales archaeon]